MTRRAVVALGIGQCVNWGVLYYAFAVLVLPLQRELGAATWVVTGAFSLALLMSAAIAPAVGRWSDRGRGPLLVQAGGLAAIALLLLWALIPTLPMLYLVWAGLGLCMAATLYEPAFAIVGRSQTTPAARLRALAIVTVFGGLASTVFLPGTAVLVEWLGWRGAVLVLAMILAVSTWSVRLVAFHALPRTPPPVSDTVPENPRTSSGPRFGIILLMFCVTSLASAAFTTNLIPALAERAVPSTTAAMLGGLLGVMQLPGRTLLMSGTLAGSPARLVTITLVLQAAGLSCFALAPSIPLVGLGVALFAIGAGMTTLVRPHLVQTMFGMDSAGRLNGQMARWQQLARAAGPILVASLASVVSYMVAFLVLSGMFAVLGLLARAVIAGGVGAAPLLSASRRL